jgi:hypothetical protein
MENTQRHGIYSPFSCQMCNTGCYETIAVEVLDDWNIFSNFLYQHALAFYLGLFLKMLDCTALVMLTRKASISGPKKGYVSALECVSIGRIFNKGHGKLFLAIATLARLTL